MNLKLSIDHSSITYQQQYCLIDETMLRLERDELLHSPIVSSRQDALYDVVEEFNVSRGNEYRGIDSYCD